LGPSQKTLGSPWCPKLVTGLGYLEKKLLKNHLSSVEHSFIEPNIEDIHADLYFPLATSSSTKRGLALIRLL